MIDSHFKKEGFGILPTVFGISSYTLFVGLGVLAGILYYLLDARKRHAKSEGVIEIVSFGLIFGVIGSKMPLILQGEDLKTILFGKSILGGLIGGMLGVMLIKKLLKLRVKMGNVIAPAVALGMAIGRLGCFFNGCCYGIPSSWGVDFGDGIPRYPTQLFEAGFHFIAFIILHHLKREVKTPGILFKYYLLAYFVFRFFIEFIRENQIYHFGLTIYQLICIVGFVYVAANMLIKNGKEGFENDRWG